MKFEDVKKEALVKMNAAPAPDFRQGLSIQIKPEGLSFNKPEEGDFTLTIKHEEEAQLILDIEEVKEFFDGWENDTKLHYFHTAYSNDPMYINIPNGLETKNILINYDIKKGAVLSTILIKAGKNSKARIIINKTGTASLVSDDIRVIGQENSCIEIITIQQINKEALNFQRRRSKGHRDSEVKWVDVCLGSAFTKSEVISELCEEGAKTENTVLYLASGTQKFDLYTASHHKAAHTISNILTRGVLHDEAKALSRGLVKMDANAEQSQGFERQDALLLSDKAEADAIPNLEIHNHDVKCSHGSTIGNIDQEKLFYLMSRGLSEKKAKEQIVEGYFAPVLDLLDAELKVQLQENITEALRS